MLEALKPSAPNPEKSANPDATRDIARHRSELLREKLFKPDDEDKYVYAVMEAGASAKHVTSELVAALEDLDPPRWQSILRIQDDYQLAQLAPYLIELEQEESDPYAREAGLTHFTEWLFSHDDVENWGFFAVSSHPFEEVLEYLSRFAVVELETGKTAFFRFANPAYFAALLSSLDEREMQLMSSKLESLCLFDANCEGGLRVVELSMHGDRISSVVTSDLYEGDQP
jgi:hypothetical protein